MDRTVITSAWLNRVHWVDGWNVIQGPHEISRPSIWVIDPTATHLQLADQYETVLSAEELARGNRFHQAAHSVRFKTAHTILRLLLSRFTSSNPTAICFAEGHHRKPQLQGQQGTPIEFNLSYSQNKAMIGIANDHPVGIDIEWLHRPLDIQDMLSACFSEREIAFITSRNEGIYQRFFTLWTRKEAVLKLTGEGIGEHLPFFEVLDGTHIAEKKIIGGQPPNTIYLYSFPVGYDFLGCFASPTPVSELFFYQL